MNEIIIKKSAIFSFILGGALGLLSTIPTMIGICGFFILPFLSSVLIILYMKKEQKNLGIIDNQQGAILGAIIGLFSSIGFFLFFCPLVLLLHLIFKNYYSYAIPEFIQNAFWLFMIILITVSLIVSATNSAMGMGLTYIISKFEKKPENFDSKLDIKIDN